MCPTGVGKMKRPTGYMSPETYMKILGEAQFYGAALRFIGWGEPTLHPQLLQFVKAAHDMGLLTHINTNGSMLDANFVGTICRIPLDSIKISMQGTNKEDYEFWRGTNLFDVLLTASGRICEIRGNKPRPFITIGTTVAKESVEQSKQFKLIAKEMCDRVVIKRTKRLGRETGCKPECPEVFDKLSIKWDGSVSCCCGDWDNQMVVGNLGNQALKQIWDLSDELWGIRRKLVEKKHSELSLCRTCCL